MTIINSTIKGKQPVIDTLNVTPSTSAQTITATGGTDGYSPVNVSAVTSAIDANITAGNIKSGVSILGVSGSVVELNGSTETVTPTTSQQTITPTSPSNGLTSVTVNAVTSAIDANIIAGNIKDGVTILGVTGDYQGGITPTGTKQITSNGTHDVTNYASAEVNVPTTAPDFYVEKSVDSNGCLLYAKSSSVINFADNRITGVGDYALSYAYRNDTNLTGDIYIAPPYGGYSDPTTGAGAYNRAFEGSNITGVTITGKGKMDRSYMPPSAMFNSAFMNCKNLIFADFSRYIPGGTNNEFNSAFSGCKNLTSFSITAYALSVNNSNASGGAFTNTFANTKLQTLSFPDLWAVQGTMFSSTCSGCTSLTSFNFDSLVYLDGSYSFKSVFDGCTALTGAVSFPRLSRLKGGNCMQYAFKNTNITSLSFPKLAGFADSNKNYFYNMLSGVTGCTVHFPSNLQSVIGNWSPVTSGFGGTNTTVLFDLPAVTLNSLDFSNVTTIGGTDMGVIRFSNDTTLVTSDMSHVTDILHSSGASLFSGCTGMTGSLNLENLLKLQQGLGASNLSSINLSSLVSLSNAKFTNMPNVTTFRFDSLADITDVLNTYASLFLNDTSLQSVYFPALTKRALFQRASGSYAYMDNMLSGCDGVTLHFPSNLQTVISSCRGYPDFGGTNITLLYDLPATYQLNGADTVLYSRNPKYDTATALAWKAGDLDSRNLTPAYYTSGLTDPQVGTTIYSDSTCTTAVTTVDSLVTQ